MPRRLRALGPASIAGILAVQIVLLGAASASLTSEAASASTIARKSATKARKTPTLPKATYSSVSREVLIPMDDGVKLAATIAWPSKDGKTRVNKKFPVVFGMTPYGRNALGGAYPADFWATRGMIGAVVDIRGAGGSGGNLEGNYFSPREAKDGAALVEWFGTRKWSTGKVGMAGGSYVGITQLLTAEQRPGHLAAIAPQVPLGDLYRDAFTHGGVVDLQFDLQYLGVQGAPGAAGVNTDPSLLADTIQAKLGQTPPGYVALDFLARPLDTSWYHDRSPIYRANRIKVPVLLLGGWHDGLSQRGVPELFQVLSKRKGVETRMSMDPCTHKGCGAPFAPLTDPGGNDDPSALAFEFLSHYLLGKQTPKRANVEYYLQGAGGYRSAATWPARDIEVARYQLGSPGFAPTTATTGGEASYVTNPLAGLSMAFNQFGTVAATPYVPTDQRLEGANGVSFQTPALKSKRDITGPLKLHLVASTTAPDTNWHAKVIDVAPNGAQSIITEGALRASHRAIDHRKSTPLRPYHPDNAVRPVPTGKYVGYDIEIWPTAYRLKAGHRLLLRITSMDLPTHMPGWINLDKSNLAATEVEVDQPAINTVRFEGSYLAVPLR